MQERGNFTTAIYDWTLLSKKRIKQVGFFFEICNRSIFVKNWWNTRYFFLLLWKDFSTDQYVLGLVDGSINFLDKREYYLSLDASMETPSKFWRDWKFSEFWPLLLLRSNRLHALFLSWIICSKTAKVTSKQCSRAISISLYFVG